MGTGALIGKVRIGDQGARLTEPCTNEIHGYISIEDKKAKPRAKPGGFSRRAQRTRTRQKTGSCRSLYSNKKPRQAKRGTCCTLYGPKGRFPHSNYTVVFEAKGLLGSDRAAAPLLLCRVGLLASPRMAAPPPPDRPPPPLPSSPPSPPSISCDRSIVRLSPGSAEGGGKKTNTWAEPRMRWRGRRRGKQISKHRRAYS